MATKKRQDEIGAIVADVEALAKRVRAGVRKQKTALPKDLKVVAGRLRKRAAHAAGQVEKYVHEIRLELEGKAKAKKPAAKRRAAKRPARKRAK
jgi:hypothetical protein